MKKLIYTYLIGAALLGLSSCKENDIPVYDVQRTALNIWFGTEDTTLDSLTYNYSYTLEESSVTFYAQIVGLPADYDRTFTIEAFEGNIAEATGSFRTETYTIPAGAVRVECPIYFDTSKLNDASSFTVNDGHLYFRVTPSNEFMEGVEEMRELVVVLKNYLAKPDNWETAKSPYYPLKRFFGDYSKEKYQFMIQVLGMMEFSININATIPYDEENNEVSYNYAGYMQEKMQQALNEYNATHDEPLKDASGALITF